MISIFKLSICFINQVLFAFYSRFRVLISIRVSLLFLDVQFPSKWVIFCLFMAHLCAEFSALNNTYKKVSAG